MESQKIEQVEPCVVTKHTVEKVPLKDLLKKIGPSIILTGIVLGPGSITTAAMLGSDYGYKMLWLLIPIGFMGIAFMMTTYRISVMTNMPTIAAIRHYYGKWAARIVGITTFLSCMFFTIGNISGTGAGMSLVFGIDWRLGAMIMIVAMLYCYFSNDFLVSDDDNGKKISEFIQAQLQEHLSGLTITITPQPKNNLNQSRRDKNYELSLSGGIAGSSDLDSYFNLYKTGSAYNYGAYDNDEYTALVEKARTTDANDPDKQFADYKQAEAILLEEDAAQVPLYQSASNYLINPKIKGIAYHLYGDYFNLRGAYIE